MANDQIQTGAGFSEAPMLGDHLALDLLNTEARSDGKVVDFWRSDEDVLVWFGRLTTDPLPTVKPTGLLVEARALRTLAHQLIIHYKAGNDIDIGELNEYLHSYLSAPHVQRDQEGKWQMRRTSNNETAKALLGPVAEAVAQLLVQGNFDLVKQCEHPDCILWFYDRTKAHKRRWCSMALCGNRYKAAQFRKKSSGDVV